ncbi:MAG: leucine-rich repeat domain-containing protein [Ruminococcaceae bacterium]|nr:leucine-rich repeat domain-containing protein [Oscillospiraceae bacterium]
MTELEAKLNAFDYEDLGDGRYAIIRLKDTLAEHAEVPEGVVEIRHSAFNCCSLLRSVSLPDTLLSIQSYAFNGCSSLEEIILPDSIKVLGDHTFASCSALKKVVLPQSLIEIPWALFDKASSLKEVVLPDGIKKICRSAFSGTVIKEIHVPISVQVIEEYAFSGSTKKVHYAGSRRQWKEVFKGKTYSNQFSLSCAVQEKKPASPKEQKSTASARSTASTRAKEEDLTIRIKACERAIRDQEKKIEDLEKKDGALKRRKVAGKINSFLFCVVPLIVGLVFRCFASHELGRTFGTLCLLWGAFWIIIDIYVVYTVKSNKNHKSEESRVSAELQEAKDIMLVLREALRLACEEGKLLGEKTSDGKINFDLPLSLRASLFEQNQTCKTCLYGGETVKRTENVNTGTIISEEHVKYFCTNRGHKEVQGENCCDNYCAARPFKAVDKALKMWEPYEEEIKIGFR